MKTWLIGIENNHLQCSNADWVTLLMHAFLNVDLKC